MNNGYLVGKATFDGERVDGVHVTLEAIEGSNELSAGRGMRGEQRGIELFTRDGRRARDQMLSAWTNENGSYLIEFRWDFLGSGGLPHDLYPYFHAHATIPSGVTVIVERTRERGWIRPSPTMVADLLGINVPFRDGPSSAAWATDVVSVLREFGMTTFPNPLVGSSVIQNMMFIGLWDIRFSFRRRR